MQGLGCKILLVGVLIMARLVSFAQTDSAAYTLLAGNVFSDKTLTKGRYLLQSNLRVSKGATLTIEAGSEILFTQGAEIVVLGGLEINGKPNKLVLLHSLSSTQEGIGVTIAGDNADALINIEYARFASLIRPLVFDTKWYRKSVSVSHSQFRNINTNDVAVLIEEAEYLQNKTTANFYFTNNVFADNTSSINLVSYSSYNIAYSFTGNVFNNNSFYDYRARVKNNPLYGQLNEDERTNIIKLENNVFLNNYVFSDEADTLIDFAGIGTEGTARVFETTNNYWGPFVNDKQVSDYTFGFNKDKFLPSVFTIPYLKTPPKDAHAFITSASAEGESVNQWLPALSYLAKDINITLSTKIPAGQKPQILIMYLDTALGIIKSQNLQEFLFSYSASNTYATINIPKVEGIEHAFYLQIRNLFDQDGIELPFINLGKFYFQRLLGTFKTQRKIDLEIFLMNAAQWKPQGGGLGVNDSDYRIIKNKEKSFELGIMNGVTNYFGDLSTNDFNRDEINYAIGLRFRYNFKKRLSFRGMFDYGHLSGNDRYSNNQYKKIRNLHFRTVLYNLSAQLEYHLNYYMYQDRYRFIPSISTGINLFYFNPQAQSGGKWYYLQPIGTEGQTTMAGKQKYNRTQFAIPLGLSFKNMIGSNIIAELEVNFVKTFTDYLDDVSDRYPNIADVQTKNSGNASVIPSLIDPSGKHPAGLQRGDPSHKDWFLTLGITFSYRF